MASPTTPALSATPLSPMTASLSSDPRSAAQRALWIWASELVAGVVLAYLLTIGLSPNVLWPTPFSVVTLGLFGVLTTAWLWVRARSTGARLGPMPLAISALLVVGAASAWASLDPARSWSAWWQTLALTAVLLLAADLFAGPRRGWIQNVVLWAGGLSMLWTWSQVAGWYGAWLSLNPQNWLPELPFRLQNPNQIALQLALLLVLAGARFAAGSARARLWLSLYIVSDVTLLFLSSSRGGWIGAAVGLVVLGMALLGREGAKAWRDRLRTMVRARPWLGGVAIVAGLVVVAGLGLIVSKQLNQPTRGGRLEYWIPALETFAAHPWLGQGQATFAVSFMRSRTAPPAVVYNHAHSIYLNTLAEGGLFGALAGLGLIAAVVAVLWKRRSDTDSAASASFALGAATLALFLAHGLVENVAFDKGNVLLVALLLASCFATADAVKTSARSWPAALPGLLAVMALALGGFGVWRDDPAHRGADLANAGDWAGAADAFAEATRRDSGSPATWQQLALAQAHLAVDDSSADLKAAIESLERAAVLDPNWPANALNLGTLYRAAGDREHARVWLERAVEAAPLVPLYHVNLGRLLEEMRVDDGAAQAYKQALTLSPTLAAAPFWHETPLRQGVLAEWTAQQPAPAADAGQVQVAAGISDAFLLEAERALAADELDRTEYWLGMADLGYWSSADARLRWAWRVAEVKVARGEAAEAVAVVDRLMQLVSEPSSFGPGTSGGSVYGTYVALRPTMQAELVPQVLDLAPSIEWPARFETARAWCATVERDARPTWCGTGETP